jgi:hypothetical protein
MKLHPTKHEPCVYYRLFQSKEVFFLRQVLDDFEIACTDKNEKDIIKGK